MRPTLTIASKKDRERSLEDLEMNLEDLEMYLEDLEMYLGDLEMNLGDLEMYLEDLEVKEYRGYLERNLEDEEFLWKETRSISTLSTKNEKNVKK